MSVRTVATIAIALGAAATVVGHQIAAAPIPHQPRNSLILMCIGHQHESTELITFEILLGPGGSPAWSWARIDPDVYAYTETATSIWIEGTYSNHAPPPNRRYVIELDSGRYAAYQVDDDKTTLLHASLPTDPGCHEAALRY
jgi:hypothetical protein